MPNLHSAGEKLQAAAIPAILEHVVALKRGAEVSADFSASSPPINHNILFAEQGLMISEHSRVFFWEVTETATLGLPKMKDIVIDRSDDSEWRIVPTASEDAWQWVGQNRTMVQVFTKQDSPNV
jgi:hypothetical protein